MMKRVIYFCLLAILGTACMEDLGTYDYTEPNEISLDTLRAQTIEIYDTLKVDPTVHTSSESTELAYCWYYYTGNELEVDTLSLEKELRYKISFPVGDYTLYLKVTDKATGLSTKSSFQLSVIGKFDKGLMVLGETDQAPSFIFINEAGNVIEIYGETNGYELGSRPVLVADASTRQIAKIKDMLVLCRDERGGVTLNNADLSITADFNSLFYVAPTQIDPQAYYKGVYLMSSYPSLADFIINNGKLHSRLLGASGDRPWNGEIAFNPAVPGDYELSPWAIVNGRAYLFYDNKNGRFLSIRGSIMSLNNTFSTVTSTSADFNPADMERSLVYMAEGAPSGSTKKGYGIFQDKLGQLELLTFQLGSYNTQSNVNLPLLSRNPVTPDADGIATAQSYAISLAKPFLFYTKGSKIYQYGLDNNSCFPVYDADTVKINGLAGNYTIDRIYIEYVPYYDGYGSTSSNYNTVMYVAASENGTSGKNGSIHVLKLADNGTVESRTALYPHVCGKTVSMCYKR